MKTLSARKKKWIEKTAKNNRKYKIILYNRFFAFLLAVVLQLIGFGILLWGFAYNSKIAVAVQLSVGVLAVIFMLYIVSKDIRPSSKFNWALVILVAPIFGVPMYLFNGGSRPIAKMKKKLKDSEKDVHQTLSERFPKMPLPEVKTRADGVSRFLAQSVYYPAYHSGDVTYFPSGEEAFPQMLTALRSAKQFILLEYFIIAPGKMWDSILEILLQKAEEGVQVRIIYDDFGCMTHFPPKYNLYLESLNENIKCMTFNHVVPFFSMRMNHRDHRKIMVVDGKIGFTGGVNLADEYIAEEERFGYWKDAVLRVEGRAVNSFTAMFFYFWNAFYKEKANLLDYIVDGGESDEVGELCVQPFDDSPLDRLSVGEVVYGDIIDRAKDYLWVTTPYLVLDDYLRMALCHAAMRGVDVRIVTPGIPDKKVAYRLTRANHESLLRAGVKIYEYTPGFMHAKTMVSDDTCAVVGSINLDYRSLYHNFENAVYFSSCDAVMRLKEDLQSTFAVSKLCTMENRKRSLIGRWVDAFLRLFQTMF